MDRHSSFAWRRFQVVKSLRIGCACKQLYIPHLTSADQLLVITQVEQKLASPIEYPDLIDAGYCTFSALTGHLAQCKKGDSQRSIETSWPVLLSIEIFQDGYGVF